MANLTPAVWYIGSVGYTAVTSWVANTARTCGTFIRATAPTAQNERVFVATNSATSAAATQPTWALTKGAKTTDGTIIYMECTGQPGSNGDATNTPTWQQQHDFSTTVALGIIIQNNGGSGLFICTTAGAMGASQPAGVTTPVLAAATTDSVAVWTCIRSASNAFTAWSAPFARLGLAFAATWGGATNGNTYYIAKNSAETQATTWTLTAPGISTAPAQVLCVDQTLGVPPTATSTGATIAVTAANVINSTGYMYMEGVAVTWGSSTNGSQWTANSGWYSFKNCALTMGGTGTPGSALVINNVDSWIMDNTTIGVGNAVNFISLPSGLFVWKNTPSAVSSPATTNGLFQPGGGGTALITNCDLTNITTILISENGLSINFIFDKCRLASGVGIYNNPTTVFGTRIEMYECDNGTAVYHTDSYQFGSQKTMETVVVLTGGASDGVTAISHKIVTGSSVKFIMPFESQTILKHNTVTGANVTVTMHGVCSLAALPTNGQIWMNVSYLGSATSVLGTKVTTAKASTLATASNLTADTSAAWDSLAAARVNSAVVVGGQIIKVASNPGRIFFCAVGGTCNGSEPVAYASATDGSNVGDGTAVFRTCTRFSMAVTLSSPQPQLVGPIAVTPVVGDAQTFYIDPLVVLS